MKKSILLFAAAALLMPLLLPAQSPLDQLYAKYVANDHFTTVNFSKEMLQMFAGMIDDKDAANAAFKESAARLTGLKIVSRTLDSLKPAPALAFYSEAVALFPPSVYQELMKVNDQGNSIRFLTKKDAGGSITELVMLEKTDREVMIMTITGIIDLATVAKISRSMDIKGMEELNKYKEKTKK